MALGDFQIYDEGAFGYPGDDEYAVASGAAASIPAGTPVAFTLGGPTVAAGATSKPVVATDFFAISASTSTDTVAAAGTVKVIKAAPGVSYIVAPKTATLWDTQAEYDALVGDRVTLDLTTGVWTINATDGATNGCVILPLNIAKHPGVVRFAFRNGVSYLT